MEKGNGQSTGGGVATGGDQAGGAGTETGTDAGPGTGTGTQPAPTDGGGAGGGGGQADQTKERDRRPSGEIINPDGSRLKINADGTWEYTDPSGNKGVAPPGLGGYVDPATGEPLGNDFQENSPPPPMGSFDQALESYRNWARSKGFPVDDSFF